MALTYERMQQIEQNWKRERLQQNEEQKQLICYFFNSILPREQVEELKTITQKYTSYQDITDQYKSQYEEIKRMREKVELTFPFMTNSLERRTQKLNKLEEEYKILKMDDRKILNAYINYKNYLFDRLGGTNSNFYYYKPIKDFFFRCLRDNCRLSVAGTSDPFANIIPLAVPATYGIPLATPVTHDTPVTDGALVTADDTFVTADVNVSPVGTRVATSIDSNNNGGRKSRKSRKPRKQKKRKTIKKINKRRKNK
jgi:hypothetical protein